jgi:hypothetical protein
MAEKKSNFSLIVNKKTIKTICDYFWQFKRDKRNPKAYSRSFKNWDNFNACFGKTERQNLRGIYPIFEVKLTKSRKSFLFGKLLELKYSIKSLQVCLY